MIERFRRGLKKMLKLLLSSLFGLVLLCLATAPLLSFTPPIDSLKNHLAQTKNSKEKLELLVELSNAYYAVNPAIALEYAYQALQVESDLNPGKQPLTAYHLLGNLYYETGLIDSASHYFHHLLTNVELIQNSFYRMVAYSNMGAVYLYVKEFDEAERYFLLAKEALIAYQNEKEALLPEPQILVLFNNLGIIQKEKEDYNQAIIYLEEGIKMSQLYPDMEFDQAKLYNNLGGIYIQTGNLSRARFLLEESLRIRKELGHRKGIAYTLYSLGQYYFESKNYNAALQHYHASLQIADSLELYDFLGLIADAFVEIYRETQQSDSVIYYLELSKKYAQESSLQSAALELKKQRMLQEFSEREAIADEKQRQLTLRYVFSIILLFLIAIAFLILNNRLRKKYRRIDSEKNELNTETESLRNEKQDLEVQMDQMNRKLTVKTVQNLQLNKKILEEAGRFFQSANTSNPQSTDEFGKAIQNLGTIKEKQFWKEFEVHFLQVYSDFFEQLYRINPRLTENDKRLCSFIRMGLTTKEIAEITGKSVDSIHKSRVRLRSRLGLTNRDVRLGEFIQGLSMPNS